MLFGLLLVLSPGLSALAGQQLLAQIKPTQATGSGLISPADDLLRSAQAGDTGRVRSILASGVPVDIYDEKGWTPLGLAALNGREEVARLLLDAGACVNCLTNDGATPLMAASLRGHVSLVQLLLRKGANPKKTNDDGVTAIVIAREKGYTEILRLLSDER